MSFFEQKEEMVDNSLRVEKYRQIKLDDHKIKSINLKFKKKISSHITKNFCVAVSGGVDSMALSFMSLIHI